MVSLLNWNLRKDAHFTGSREYPCLPHYLFFSNALVMFLVISFYFYFPLIGPEETYNLQELDCK